MPALLERSMARLGYRCRCKVNLAKLVCQCSKTSATSSQGTKDGEVNAK